MFFNFYGAKIVKISIPSKKFQLFNQFLTYLLIEFNKKKWTQFHNYIHFIFLPCATFTSSSHGNTSFILSSVVFYYTFFINFAFQLIKILDKKSFAITLSSNINIYNFLLKSKLFHIFFNFFLFIKYTPIPHSRFFPSLRQSRQALHSSRLRKDYRTIHLFYHPRSLRDSPHEHHCDECRSHLQ